MSDSQTKPGSRGTAVTLDAIVTRTLPPEPWTEGDNIPWDDPGFSARMLAEHLDDSHDHASRRGAVITEHVAWLHTQVLGMKKGRVLDLACGPGLYLHRLALLGHQGVGLDFSPMAIEYARSEAKRHSFDCEFTQVDLRDAEFGEGFDLVTLVYGQLDVFTPMQARDIASRALAALEPGGALVLELQEPAIVQGDVPFGLTWRTRKSGVFSADPHLLLHERFWDEVRLTSTERWHVVDAATGGVQRYAMSTCAYSRERIEGMLKDVGYEQIACLDSSLGVPQTDPPRMYTVVARKPADAA